MTKNYYAVIMAGGGGTRLWPLSRQQKPKQVLKLVDERSLFQTAVDRLAPLFSPDQIYVVTVAEQANLLKAQYPQIPDENYLIEPMPRGTASVVGMAALAVQKRDPEAVMAVLTADHLIQHETKFIHLLQAAYEIAQEQFLVTLGIDPLFASTGYGYIQQGEWVRQAQNLDVYRVKRFTEKPDEATAKIMLAGGDHAWNSGMFVWRVDVILKEIDRQMPALAEKLAALSMAWNQPEYPQVIQQVWPQIQPETIDYGIMENAQNAAVIPANNLGWSDVGSWDALFDVLPSDADGNIAHGGRYMPLETRNTLAYTQDPTRLVVSIGVEDLIIVDTGDVILVCRKDLAQNVRQVVGQLKNEGQQNYI